MTSIGFLILFFLGCLLFLCEGQVQPPSNGTRLIFFLGSTVKIDWSYVGDISQVDLRAWFFNSSDGSRTGRLARVLVDGDPGQKDFTLIPRFEIDKPAALILKNVDQSYNGMYTFSLLDGTSAQSQTSEVVVFIAMKPTVTINCRTNSVTVDEGKNFTVDEGKDFTCVCRGKNGNPPAEVTWYKDNVQTGTIGKEEETLTRSNVIETDSGTYKCVAQSHTLTAEKSIVVKVRPNAKPKVTGITFVPNPAEVGEEVTITCVESEGVPEPSYTTSHNGEEVGSKKTFTISVKRGDGGQYKCVAQNKFGSDSATANLTVIEPRSTTKPPSASTSKKPSNGPDPGNGGGGVGGLGVGAIIGIVIGVLALLVIVIFVVWRFKLKESKFCR